MNIDKNVKNQVLLPYKINHKRKGKFSCNGRGERILGFINYSSLVSYPDCKGRSKTLFTVRSRNNILFCRQRPQNIVGYQQFALLLLGLLSSLATPTKNISDPEQDPFQLLLLSIFLGLINTCSNRNEEPKTVKSRQRTSWCFLHF